MYRKITTLGALILASGSAAFANTPLLVNTDFSSYEGWIFGANRFQPVSNWLEFVQAPDAFTYESRLQPSGNGFVFTSWDDGAADKIEAYIFQEFDAGPSESAWPSIFQTGDVIVFKGAASATRTGPNTSDMVVRAFIKVLGYNELGWEFQLKQDYSAMQPIGDTLQPFELSITFPDLAADDSLQVVQIGFEISTIYDPAAQAMDSGTIYFENIEAYIVGESGGDTWAGYPVGADGWADTGAWMGYVYVTNKPWIYVHNMSRYIYLPDEGISETGAWAFAFDSN